MGNNGKRDPICQEPKGSANPSNDSRGRIKSLGMSKIDLGPSKGQRLGSPAPRNPYSK